MDAIAVAQYGMMAAVRRLDSAAGRLTAPEGAFDAEAMTELIQAKTQFKAQIATLRIADDMQRALLEIQADGG